MTKILVIDDNAPFRNDMAEILAFENYEVALAEDGLVGIEKAEAEKPDLIICDLMMPRMSADGVINHLSQSSELAAIPVILMVSHLPDGPTARRPNFGQYACLQKPFLLDELYNTVAQALKSKS